MKLFFLTGPCACVCVYRLSFIVYRLLFIVHRLFLLFCFCSFFFGSVKPGYSTYVSTSEGRSRLLLLLLLAFIVASNESKVVFLLFFFFFSFYLFLYLFLYHFFTISPPFLPSTATLGLPKVVNRASHKVLIRLTHPTPLHSTPLHSTLHSLHSTPLCTHPFIHYIHYLTIACTLVSETDTRPTPYIRHRIFPPSPPFRPFRPSLGPGVNVSVCVCCDSCVYGFRCMAWRNGCVSRCLEGMVDVKLGC